MNDAEGRTTLTISVGKDGKEDVTAVGMLIKYRVDTNATDNSGESALPMAAKWEI